LARRPSFSFIAAALGVTLVVIVASALVDRPAAPLQVEVAGAAASPAFPVHAQDRNRAALEERVIALADELEALPVSHEDREQLCPLNDIAITYERIPPSRFELGAYIEPLVRPHPTQGTHALGIAYCRRSSVAIMGFEALWSDDEGWSIWPVPSPEDLHGH